jgi:hypothetical protein
MVHKENRLNTSLKIINMDNKEFNCFIPFHSEDVESNVTISHREPVTENCFTKTGYLVVRNVLNKQILELLKIQTKLQEKIACFQKNKKITDIFFGDSQVTHSYSHYGLLCYESLLQMIQPIIENHIQKKLFPTYSYVRIYYKDAILNRHTDRNSCEYSASVCIHNDSNPWDIYLKTLTNEEVCVSLQEGDIVIYRGNVLEHWRNKYEGNEQIQAFLHYVDKNGDNKDYIYDKRPFIGLSK